MQEHNVTETKTPTQRVANHIRGIEDSYRSDGLLFAKYVAAYSGPVDSLLRDYAKWLAEDHDGKRWSAATQAVRLAAAKKRLRYVADRSGLTEAERFVIEKSIQDVRSPKVQRSNPRNKTLTREEVAALVVGCTDARAKLMIEFLYQTGCRVSELCAAEWNDLLRRRRGENGEWYSRLKLHGKGSKEREVALRFELILRIREQFHGHRFIFESTRGRKYHRNSVSSRVHYWAAAVLGRTDVSAHTLRHSYATHQIDRGQSVTKIQRQLGHSSIATTSIYIHDEMTDEEAALTAPR